MDHRPLVVLLGDSLLLDGVADSLESKQELRVLQIDTSTTDLQEHLNALGPELIVFEMDSPRSPPVLSLLTEQPGIPIFGLDLTCSQVLILNSSQHPTRTMNDLCQLAHDKVTKHMSGKEVDRPDIVGQAAFVSTVLRLGHE